MTDSTTEPGRPPTPPAKRKSLVDSLKDPAVIVAGIGFLGIVLTNASDISSVIREWIAGMNQQEARQNAFFKQAIEEEFGCVFSTEFYFKHPKNIQVDPSLCEETGDYFFRIQTEDGRRMMAVIFVDDLLAQSTGGRRQAALTPTSFGAAYAAPSPDWPTPLQSLLGEETSQVLVTTICQRIEDDGRTLIRRVSRDGQCFDERWDTASGNFLSEAPSSCDATC